MDWKDRAAIRSIFSRFNNLNLLVAFHTWYRKALSDEKVIGMCPLSHGKQTKF